MKNVLLVLVLLMSGVAFAVDTPIVTLPLSASLSASGSAQVGMDLDQNFYGIKNSTSSSVTLNILNGSANKGEEGGTIKVSDIFLKYDASTGGALTLSIGSVVAKVVLGDLYVKLASFADSSVSYQKDISKSGLFIYSGLYGATSKEIGVGAGGSVGSYVTLSGLEFGYTLPGFATLTVNANTVKSGWSSVNNPELKGELSIIGIPGLTWKLAVIGTPLGNGATGFGGQFAYDFGFIAPFAGLDYGVSKDQLDTSSTTYGVLITPIKGLSLLASGKYDQNVTFAGKTGSSAILTGSVSGLLPVNLKTGVILGDLGANVKPTVGAFGQIDGVIASGVDFYVKGSYDNSGIESLYGKARINFTKLVSLASVGIEYDSNNLLATSAKLGQLFLEVSVSY